MNIEEIKLHLEQGNRIKAIKAFREMFPNSGLKEAKEVVDLMTVIPNSVPHDVVKVVITIRLLKQALKESPPQAGIDWELRQLINRLKDYIIDEL